MLWPHHLKGCFWSTVHKGQLTPCADLIVTNKAFNAVIFTCSLISGESVPVDEQFDKEKANAEVKALDNIIAEKEVSTPNVPGARLTDVEKDKCPAEVAKLYKQLDDKVSGRHVGTGGEWMWGCTRRT